MFRYFAWLRFEKARLDGAGFMSGLERTKIFNEVDFTGFDTQGEKRRIDSTISAATTWFTLAAQ